MDRGQIGCHTSLSKTFSGEDNTQYRAEITEFGNTRQHEPEHNPDRSRALPKLGISSLIEPLAAARLRIKTHYDFRARNPMKQDSTSIRRRTSAFSNAFVPLLITILVTMITTKTQFGSFRRLSVPRSLQADEIFGLRIFANLDRFNSFSGDDIGWPLGQNLWDYPPVGELWNLGFAWLLAKVFDDTFISYNVFYLLTFISQCLCAYFCVKKLTNSLFAAALAAIIFPTSHFTLIRAAAISCCQITLS